MEPDFILTQTTGSTGHLTVNRPSALNALSKDMCAVMNKALLAWVDDPAIDRVLITAAAGRAFCAGGDVRSIIPLIKQDPRHSDEYFFVEYTLHSIINSYPKPVMVLADGLTMGAGSGLLLNASHPVITEKMDFSMPETAIGLFPDVAASLFLRRASGMAGVLMGMTGWRINAADMCKLGIANIAVKSADLDQLCRDFIALEDISGLDDLLAGYIAPMGDDATLANELDWINDHFGHATPSAIRASLEGDDHPLAEKLRHALDSRSPLSIALTHELLTNDAHKQATILDAIMLDYVLACRISRLADFSEGVRALLIDKDNAPNWMHDSLDQVGGDVINELFANEDRPALTLPEAYIPFMKKPSKIG